MHIDLYTRWNFDPKTIRVTLLQSNTRSFENMVLSSFQRTRPDCKIKSLYTSVQQADREKLTASVLMVFLLIATMRLKPCTAFITFFPCQEFRSSLTEDSIQRGSRKRKLNELRRSYILEKVFTVSEMLECE